MPNEPQLKPCPFCGNPHPFKADKRGFAVWTQCGDCGARGPEKLTGSEADKAWNTRKEQPE